MIRKSVICLVSLCVVVSLILGGCGSTPEQSISTIQTTPVTTTPSTTSPSPTATPADIKIMHLDVTPIVAEPGMHITIEVKAMNMGETEGAHTLTLAVNGMDEETRNVTLAPWATDIVTFTLIRDASGTYEIEVAGLTETLIVKQPGSYPKLFCYNPILSLNPTPDRARWDLVVIQEEARFQHPGYLELLKELNPNIKILAFIAVGCYTPAIPRPYSIPEDWFLHHPGTNPPEERRAIIFTWEGEHPLNIWYGLNPASEFSNWVAEYVHDEIMSTGLFDGVFYDCLYDNIAWLSNIDIDNDGVADSNEVVNLEYQKGWTELLKSTRELLGSDAIIIGNPGGWWTEDSPYWEYANGHMQECCLSAENWASQWPAIWEIYQRNMLKPSPPARVHLIDAAPSTEKLDVNTADLPSSLLKKMRFGLTITLLGDGYYFFNSCYGVYFWWFPEYNANLGFALEDAQIRSDGTWMREFENGVVLVNPTNEDSSIELGTIYQDVTTGDKGTHFIIQPDDGRIFIKCE